MECSKCLKLQRAKFTLAGFSKMTFLANALSNRPQKGQIRYIFFWKWVAVATNETGDQWDREPVGWGTSGTGNSGTEDQYQWEGGPTRRGTNEMGDYRADPITCSPREDGLSCRHGVKPPLTHMRHHCLRTTCLCVHSPDAQYGLYPIRGYFLTQMAEDLLIWQDCLGPQLNPGSHTRLRLGGLSYHRYLMILPSVVVLVTVASSS